MSNSFMKKLKHARATLHGWILQPLFIRPVILTTWRFYNSQLTGCIKWSHLFQIEFIEITRWTSLTSFGIWWNIDMFSFFYFAAMTTLVMGNLLERYTFCSFFCFCFFLSVHTTKHLFLSNTAAQWAEHICWYRGCLQMSHRDLCSRRGKYHSLWPISGQWSYFGFGLTVASFESSCCT